MNHRVAVLLIIMAAIALLVMGCSKEKEENPGNETAVCMQCHGDNGTLQEDVQAFKQEWANSRHSQSDEITLITSFVQHSPCSGCHMSQGFITRLTGADPGTVTSPSPIHCFTCHAPHSNFNFDLRTSAPVALKMGGIFNYGNGNICANCHEALIPSPRVAVADTINDAHWGPHHSTMSNVLSGQGAYVINGSAVYLDTSNSDGYGPDNSNSPHNNPALLTQGCPMCHMATPVDDIAGGHSMNMTYAPEFGPEADFTAGCNQSNCHSGLADFNVDGKQDSIVTLISTLGTALASAGLLDPAADTTLHPTTPTQVQAAALYNYFFIQADRSMGVHNYKYSRDVLNASIAALASR